MSSNGALARAQRRHKVLRRQKNSLLEKNMKDDVVETELLKLELEFPELKEEEPQKTAPSSSGEAELPGAPSRSPTVTPTPEALTTVTPTSMRPESFIAAAWPSTQDVSPPTLTDGGTRAMSPDSPNPFRVEMFSWWFLRLYTAAQHRSLFGPLNFGKVVITSVLIAVVHCFVLDPCSDLGASLQPSFICLMIHIGVLYSMFLRRPDVLSSPMLLAYFLLDVLPSIALALLTYSLAMCTLNICGAPRAPVACV